MLKPLPTRKIAAGPGLSADSADTRWVRAQLDGVLREPNTDFLVISVGGKTLWPRRKDGGWTIPANASGAMAECHGALRQILEQVDLSRKKALVLSVIPRCTADAELLELTEKVNQEFENLAFSKGAAFVSVADALAVELEASGEIDDVNFEEDGTHLTREAERKVWAAIKEAVNKPLWG